MALERMHDVLHARLLADGATPPQEVAWQKLWDSALDRTGEPLPCPACFVATGQPSRVSPRNNVGGMAAARCDVCKADFQWPDDH